MSSNFLMNTYNKKITIENGEGCYLYDSKGKKYLDLIGGIATSPLGHGNKEIAEVMYKQALSLVTASNLFHTIPQQKLAQKLCGISEMSHCFFSNSGTEANECAIKLAKKFTGKHHFIAMKNGFHGRTLGSLAATWKEKYKKPFEPMLSKFNFVEFGNLEELTNAITEETAAVILEPIQGEAGIIVPPEGYLKEVRKITKEKNVLLIIDEIQTGNGRTGKYFAYQHEGIIPDIVTTAKGLANGLPIGATLSVDKIDFAPGDHGSTFGGNDLCCTVALKTLEIIECVMSQVQNKGEYFCSKLEEIDKIKEVRGKGLIFAIELENSEKVAQVAAEKGILLNVAGPTSIRFLPPYTITKEDMDFAVDTLKTIIDKEG